MQNLDDRPPIIVGAHGIAGQKDMGLEPFAEFFAAKGMAALLFDYRNFGGSEGEPRNWVSPSRHLQDWAAALDYIRASLALPMVSVSKSIFRSHCHRGVARLLSDSRKRTMLIFAKCHAALMWL